MAKQAARVALDFIRDNGVYRRWFGTYDSTNADWVRYFVQRYLTLEFEARCGGGDCCGPDEPLGCVDHADSPWDDEKLYLCSGWWDLPLLRVETESRAGMMIREHTHLPSEYKASDVTHAVCDPTKCYGANNARALAQTCTPEAPDLSPGNWPIDLGNCWAVWNAENYEKFVADSMTQIVYIATIY